MITNTFIKHSDVVTKNHHSHIEQHFLFIFCWHTLDKIEVALLISVLLNVFCSLTENYLATPFRQFYMVWLAWQMG